MPALVALGLVGEAVWVGVVLLGDLRASIPEFLTLFACAALVLVAALWVSYLFKGQPNFRVLLVFLLFGVVFRATVFFAPPSLSDDIYRYLWEGRLVVHQENPFDLPPDAPEHRRFRDDYHDLINFPEMTTIYPPVAQVYFAASQLINHQPWSIKLLALLADLFLILILVWLLKARGQNPNWVVIYAWHPLPIIEFSGSGHLDVLAILLMFVAFLLLTTGRTKLAGCALALSGLTKFFAFALAPAFARRMGWGKILIIVSALVILLYLPFIGAGFGLVRSFSEYASRWYFNASLFVILEAMLGSAVARVVSAVSFVLIGLFVPRWIDDDVKVGFYLAGVFVLLSPTVHPWYLVWVVPFLCFFRRVSWIYLSLAVVSAYTVLTEYSASGLWQEESWVRYAEYMPFAVILITETWRTRMHRS